MNELEIQESSEFDGNRPLISFCLFAYNQEQYVREAVEGAFAQVYSPLEIILSDDCSSDNTFAIMQEMVSTYNGPHKIILNKTKKNNGFVNHVNSVAEIASGELIVFAAGDDISCNNRVFRISEVYLSSDDKPTGILSDMEVIDENGKSISGDYKPVYDFTVNMFLMDKVSSYGAVQAVSKTVFDFFGDLKNPFNHEDQIVAFRALLLGKIIYIPEKLVRYRRTSQSISRKCSCLYKEFIAHKKSSFEDSMCGNANILQDYLYFCTKTNNAIDNSMVKRIRDRIDEAYWQWRLYDNDIIKSALRFVVCMLMSNKKKRMLRNFKEIIVEYLKTRLFNFKNAA